MPDLNGYRIECPPKVNLYLRVVRKRGDGFHELETVFRSISDGDTLYGFPSEALSLRCSDPELPTDERNLVTRAALLLQRRFPGAKGASLRLEKRTPMGGGLGGGSVDAAAALVLLSQLWGLDPEPGVLAEIAAELGSDVPFFLHGGCAVARGRGEQLEPGPEPSLWLVLVRPPVAVSTPWAYRQWRAEACGGPSLEEFLDALRTDDPEVIAGALRNDLEPGVAAGVPEIDEARRWLLEHGALGARMTGSGSVVFGVARDGAHARSIAAAAAQPNAHTPGLVWAVPCLTSATARLQPAPFAEHAAPGLSTP